MATFSKRGDLQWQAKIRRSEYPFQSKTFSTKAEAEAWARQIETEMDRGVFGLQDRGRKHHIVRSP